MVRKTAKRTRNMTQSKKEIIDAKWQLIKQSLPRGPLHKMTMCFACGITKDCKAVFLCDDCIKIIMEATEVIE